MPLWAEEGRHLEDGGPNSVPTPDQSKLPEPAVELSGSGSLAGAQSALRAGLTLPVTGEAHAAESRPETTLTRPLPARPPQHPQEVLAWFSARTETEIFVTYLRLISAKVGGFQQSTSYHLESEKGRAVLPGVAARFPCGRRITGSLLTAGVGPGPQPVHSIAAGPSVWASLASTTRDVALSQAHRAQRRKTNGQT